MLLGSRYSLTVCPLLLVNHKYNHTIKNLLQLISAMDHQSLLVAVN